MRTLVPGQEGPDSLLTESGVALSLQGVEEGTGEPFDELLGKGWKKVRAGRQLQSSLLKDALSRKNRRERTDGGGQGSERQGLPGPARPRLGMTVGRWIPISLQLVSWSG